MLEKETDSNKFHLHDFKMNQNNYGKHNAILDPYLNTPIAQQRAIRSQKMFTDNRINSIK